MNRELAPPPSHIRTSFVEPLNNTDNGRFTQWPNFTFQGENKNGNDRQSIRSSIAASTTGILFPAQNVIKQKSGFFIRVKGMCTTFPVRDMSWATGVLFTIGSAVFVINGFFLLLPLVAPQTNFKNETPYATPASSMLGTIIFILGGWTGFLEGMNLKRGEVLEVTEGIEVEVLQVSRRDRKMMDEEQGNINSKSNNISWPLGNPLHQTTPLGMPSSSSSPPPSMSPPPHIALLGSSRFIWWPSAQQYRVYYRRDLIFSAGFVQFIGTFIFAIASITAVPGVISFENILLVDLSNLGPATLGGLFFLTAAMCQILNAQERWYVPRPTTLDWQIGFWNAVGSLGFTLAGALPYIGTTNATLQATLADFWGSWAFLVGSLLQWYSSLGNYC